MDTPELPAQQIEGCASQADAPLAKAAKALSHPARLAILRTIAKQSRCNCAQICGHVPLAQSTVSQHLRVLNEAGLIQIETDGPNSRYTLAASAITTFAETLTALAKGLCADADACCGPSGSCCKSNNTTTPSTGAQKATT